MIYQKQISGDFSLNIQAGRDVNFNFDTDDVANIIKDQMDELFHRLSNSNDTVKKEIIHLINDNKMDDAKEKLDSLVDETTNNISQDFLDFANLYLILAPEKSENFYKKSIELNSNNNAAKNAYALRLMHIGKLDEAELVLKSSLLESNLTSSQKESLLGNLGILYKNTAVWDKSLESLKSALELSISNNNDIGTVKHLNSIGSCYTNLENLDESGIYLERAIKSVDDLIECCDNKVEKNEYKRIKSNILTNMSIRLRHLWFKDKNNDHLMKAKNYLEIAVEIADILDEKVEIMRHWGNLSNIYRQLNDNTEAKKYIIKSLDLSVNICDVRGEVCNLINLGLIYFDEGSFDSAIEYFQQGLHKENKQYPKLRGHIFSNLALANRSKGDLQAGKYFFDKAMAIYQRLDLKDSINEIIQSYDELKI